MKRLGLFYIIFCICIRMSNKHKLIDVAHKELGAAFKSFDVNNSGYLERN